MKKVIFCFALIISQLGFSQKLKVDLDPKSFNYEFVRLPKEYIEPSRRTFDVVTTNSQEYHWLYNNDVYSRKIAINGFTRSQTAPSILIEVSLSPIMDMGSGVNSNSSKRSDGTTVTNYGWKMMIKGTGKYSINYNGKVATYPISADFNTSSSSNNFPTFESANKNYYDNYSSARENLVRQFVEHSIKTIYNGINDLYGYRIVNQKEEIWILDSKDNPEYQSHQNTLKDLTNYFAGLKYNTGTQLTYDNVKSIIDYYEKAKSTYSDPDDKKHRKMRYASYYNLMKIYFALDMFDNALAEANALIANDYDTKDGEAMVKRINEMKSRLSANNVNTTHMEVEPIYVR